MPQTAIAVRFALRMLLVGTILAPALPAAGEPARFSREELQRHLEQVKAIQVALNRLGADKFFVRERQRRVARGRARGARRAPPKPGSGARPAPQEGQAPRRRSAPVLGLDAATAVGNVKLNDSAGDFPAATQSEVAIAALGDLVLAAWNDGQGSSTGGAYQGFAWSIDAGQTWVDGGDPPKPPTFPQFRWTSDPVLTVCEKTGVFYYCAMANTSAGTNGIAVARGLFNGGVFTWQDVEVAREVSNTTAFLDKPWIAADSSGAGTSVYLSYTTYTVAGNQIDFQRSTDAGSTWGNATRLSSVADRGQVQASRPVVGPAGQVHVMWFAIGQGVAEDFLRYRKSTNGGQSFAGEVTVSDFISNFGTGSPGYNRERGIHFPSMAVDRTNGLHRGRVYVAWNEAYNFQDDPLGTTGVARVEAEPNGEATSANAFQVGDVLRGVTASAEPADLDYWSFSLAEGQSIVVWADSLPAGQTYALRIFPSGPDQDQSLTFGGDFTPGSFINQAFYTFTAPLTSTYYLRMGPIDGASVAGGYRVRTGPGARAGERGRDQRDAFVSWSDDGLTWSAPVRMNDDKAGLDEYLAEIGVGADGCPYATWFDYREHPYGASAHVYLSRSVDGGATWAANQRLTTVPTFWYQTGSNLAPNMGDYNGIGASAQRLHLGWADGRDGGADVYGTTLELGPAIQACAPATGGNPGAAIELGWTIANPNALFENSYTVSVAAGRAWPMPAAFEVAVPAGGQGGVGFVIQIPDSASPGAVPLVFTQASELGALAARCTTTVTVSGTVAVGVPGAQRLSLAPSVPNPARGEATLSFTTPHPGRVTLRVFGLRGERVRTLLDTQLGAGAHQARWDGRDDQGRPVAAGAYFYRLDAAGGSLTRPLVWLPW